MNPFVRYTLLRILLFGAVLAFLVALHVRGFVLFAGALLVSAALSYLLLGGPRREVVTRIDERVSTRSARRTPDRDSLVEDAQIDQAERSRPTLPSAQRRGIAGRRQR